MDQLEVQIRLIPVATPPLQQKVDEIAQMLHLMAQLTQEVTRMAGNIPAPLSKGDIMRNSESTERWWKK
ncbi:hypothetical protein GHY79_21090 [Salmonella enterica subsp. enterica serovar Enteritidis]|nr:hypothetical protein [Salmonella enterica subsp. enterica serovar Enteritidis]